MKKIGLILAMLFVVSIVMGQQQTNKERIAQLPELIEEQAAAEKYDEAAKLSRELELREELEIALKDKDYKKAAQLKDELEKLEKEGLKTSTDAVTTAQKTEERPVSRKKENIKLYLDLTFAGFDSYVYDRQEYVEMYDENGYYIGSTMQTVRTRDNMFALNLKLGNKFFFGPGEKKFRLGLDVNYLSLNMGLSNFNNGDFFPNMNFSIVRPGIVGTLFLNEKRNMGIDFQVNGGMMFALTRYDGFIFPPNLGVSVNPHIKFWYNKIGGGIEFNYGRMRNTNDIVYQHVGLFFGFRF